MITNLIITEENKFSVCYFLETIKKELNKYEFKTFNLGVSYPYSLTDDEKQLLKKEFQFTLVKEIENKLNVKRTEESFGDINILIDYNYNRIEFIIMPIFIYGIYNKYSRELPQTIDYCFKCRGRGCNHCNNKGILREISIQEIIENYFKEKIKFKELKFHGAGREDINVLMLGNGREFVIELIEPETRFILEKELKEIEDRINNFEKEKIKLNSLKNTIKEKVAEIKNEKYFKEYLAIVKCENKLDNNSLDQIKNTKIKIKQFTPKRVSKRRALITRERIVEILTVEKIDDVNLKIKIKAEAGLYVKEFISGEENKTSPSISEIIKNKCSCTQLDVIWIYR